MIAGFLDGFRGRELYGWASPTDGREPAIVDIIVDGEHAGRVMADQYREDLRSSGIRDGRAGFTFKLADHYCDGKAHAVDARIADTSNSLTQSPQSFAFEATVRTRREWCQKNIVLSDFDRCALSGSLFNTRKLVIFATYHKQSAHLVYHRQIIESFLSCGFTILVVHATDNQSRNFKPIESSDCFLLLKRNIGYDFGSYATGFLALGDLIEMVDELILINDSIIQIKPDLWPMLQALRAADADVVACTESFERQYHLQSYLVWLGKNAISSTALAAFMTDYTFTSVKERVIEEGEIGFSRCLQAAGMTLKALYEYPMVASIWLDEYRRNVSFLRNLPGTRAFASSTPAYSKELEVLEAVMRNVISGTPTNPSHFFWDVLIDHFGFPFIKRELIVVNPCSVPTYAKIAKVIADHPKAHEAVYGMIRAFGGNLVPALVTDNFCELERDEPAAPERSVALFLDERSTKKVAKGL